MSHARISIAASAILTLLPAALSAGEPLRVGVISPERKGCEVLPAKAGERPVHWELIQSGPLPPDLNRFDVLVFLPELAAHFQEIDRHADLFREYVQGGGGIVVFQPNPMGVYPPGAGPMKSAPAALANNDGRATPAFLPLTVTFYNWYQNGEKVQRQAVEHPITAGLGDDDMPFPSDRMFDVDRGYTVLAIGKQTESPSLLAARFGKGRIVISGDNVGGGANSKPAATVVQRSLLWAAGVGDDEVRAVRVPAGQALVAHGRISGDLGSFESVQFSPPWPDRATAEAVAKGRLTLSVDKVAERLRPFEPVHLHVAVQCPAGVSASMPANVVERFGAELAPADDPSRVLVWRRPQTPTTRPAWTLDRSWSLYTAVHFLSEPLKGLPADDAYAPPGRYKWRLVVWGDPPLYSEWHPVEIAEPSREAIRKRYERAGQARARFMTPKGNNEEEAETVGDIMQLAKSGDIIYCEPGVYQTNAFAIPDGVRLIGSGAGSTVINVRSSGRGGTAPRVHVGGYAWVQGLTIRGADGSHDTLVYCEGKDSRATFYQCLFLPGENDFSAVTAWGKAWPTLRNCVIVSPVGDYGVFARDGAKPVIEHCTIISRGFGVGMKDCATPTIRRSIIAGARPAVISDDGKFDLADSVVFCPVVGPQGYDQALKSPGKTLLERKDIRPIDPQFALAGGVLTFFLPKCGVEPATYGAFAGEGGLWPAGCPPYADQTAMMLTKMELGAWLTRPSDK